MTGRDVLDRHVDLGLDTGLRPGELVWRDAEEHLAPVAFLPLDNALLGKTHSALLALMAGCLVLSAKRLATVAETVPCYWMAEALLCFAAHPAYIEPDYQPQFPRGPLPPPQDAVRALCRTGSTPFFMMPGKHSKFPPSHAVKNLVFLTKHLLAPDLVDAFRSWLEAALERIGRLASNPDQDLRPYSAFASKAEWDAAIRRDMGPPVPIELLDARVDLTQDDLAPLYRAFLASVDWSANPYLASPDRIRAAGVTGTPYGP